MSSELKVQQEDGGQICRDFLRNVCTRGKNCKFKHPESGSQERTEGMQDKMMFCHDFQNSRCQRSSCRFIHCTKDVEAEYFNSGYLPPLIREQVIKKAVAVDFPAVEGGIPICKDFLKGKCKRTNRCRFRHLNPQEYDMEMNAYQTGATSSHQGMATFFDDDEVPERPSDRKRRHLEPVPGPGLEAPPGPPPFLLIQEENLSLRNRVVELERKVSDLRATNEFLLEQNAQLRINGGTMPSLSRPGGPAHHQHPPPPTLYGGMM